MQPFCSTLAILSSDETDLIARARLASTSAAVAFEFFLPLYDKSSSFWYAVELASILPSPLRSEVLRCMAARLCRELKREADAIKDGISRDMVVLECDKALAAAAIALVGRCEE